MPLTTTTRGSEIGRFLPGKDALLQCMAIATDPETADYLAERFERRLINSGFLEQSRDVLKKIKEYAHSVHLQKDAQGDPWSGNKTNLHTDFRNMQKNLAQQAAATVVAKIKARIKMDFAVSDLAQVLRGYLSDGKSLDTKTLNETDKLFNAWLAEHNLISKESVIYQATEQGDIIRDENGNARKADAEALRALIVDKKEGFQQFLEKKGIEAELQEHKYTEQQPAADKQLPQKANEPSADYEGVRIRSE